MRWTPRRFAFLLVMLACLRLPGQQVTLAGLKSLNQGGAFHGLRQDTAGNLYTLFAAGDGVRVLKFNAAGTALLGQAQVGQPGDIGIALDLDPAGNIYVTGTSDSRGSITGTAGTAFPNRAGTRTNSFVAKFTPALTPQWLTFCGAEPMAVAGISVTSSSVLITGSIFQVGDPANALPVTPNGIQQSPAPASTSDGFVENFTTAAGTLQYATYLTGANGATSPAAIVADSSGNAYIAGATTATGFPTTAALVPVFRSAEGSNVSGFVTKLDAGGDDFLFSTFVPGNGLTGIALDTGGTGALLLSGDVAAGLFPLTEVQAPIAALLHYQTAVRMALNGSSVLSSTLLAPGTESVIAPAADGAAWVFGSSQSLSAPMLPVVPVESIGNAFAVRIDENGKVDRAARFGGLPTANSGYASLPATEGGVAVLPDGTVALAGSVAPTLSSSLLPTQHYDLPFVAAPTTALPSTVRDALPPSDCSGSACSGSAGLLAMLAPDGSAAGLALSIDDVPSLTLRNLGTATADNLQITSTGYTLSSNCGSSLAPAAECRMALTGNGPGTITVAAANVTAFTTALPATTRSANNIAVLPRELEFGLQTAGSTVAARTLTVANLGASTQTFVSKNTSSVKTAYTVGETATTCTPAGDGVSKVLGPGGTCTITLGLSASSDAANDRAIDAHWQAGSSDILLTGYAQAAAETLSASTIDFGRQFAGGLRSPRLLYLSNSSDSVKSHAAVSSTNAAFTLVDECPATLQPRSVCRMVLNYNAVTAPSSDAMSMYVDGLIATVLGETLPQPSITSSSTNPNLSVSPAAVGFTTAVAATTVSSESHTVTVGNTGTAPFALTLSVAGDYSYGTNCPASLAGNSSCNVVVTFTPSGAGTRDGLLSVAAGSSGPVYVALGGTGTGILPPGNSSLSFGDVPLNTPSVQWLKVSQSFASLQAASSDPSFTVLLVEDTGYGHGDPPASAFSSTASGSCLSCYLGVQFLPVAAGAHNGNVSLTSSSGGKAVTLNVSGNGTPLTGLILTPVAQDFGPVPVHSSAASTIFQLTNGTPSSVTPTGSATTGDFVTTSESTGGATCTSGMIAPGASCFVPVRFSPSATGTRTGTLTVSTSAGQATSSLSGTGSDDRGTAFTPGELRFDNVPGSASTQGTVTITNTGSTSQTVGTPVVSDAHFSVSNGCGTLAAGASCTLTITYATRSALAGGTLSVPITTAPAGVPGTTTYALALSGLYTTESAGLQIIPGEHTAVNFGASLTGVPALSRVLHVNNLTAKALALVVDSPRQFATTSSTCGTLAPNGSCDLTVEYTPLSSGDTTGTVFLTGTPADGTPTQTGIGYLEGYGVGGGTGNASLVVTGNISPAGVVSFGQVASGQTATQTLTVTNPTSLAAGTVLTVRRVLSEFPYLATTTCGEPLTPGQSCTITVTYSPVFQVATGSGQNSTHTDADVLTIVSDGSTAPQFVDLNGSTTPVFVTTPNNTAPLAAFVTSPGSLYFGDVPLGSASPSQAVTITNTGTATVHVTGVLPSSGYSATSGCATLVSGATCTLQVSFAPQTPGAALGSIEIQSDASAPLELISLLGNGIAAPVGTASATLSPQSLDFGRVLVGRSASQLATLTNTGSMPVMIASVSISGDAAFALAASSTGANACPAAGGTLAAGSSCTIAVVFTPAGTGTLRGTLTVVTSVSSVPLTVALSGVGTQPQLSVAPASLSFGNVAVGSTSTLSITLVNTGNQAVDGLALSVTAGFSVSSTCGITALNAASSCAVSVTFAPASVGVVNGALTVSSTDPASPLTLPLSGAGTIAAAASLSTLTATPSTLNFGNVAPRGSTTLALVLSNPTAVPANSLLFTPSAGFSVSSGCGTALNAYSTCPVVVTFAPTVTGAVTGTLTVQSSTTTPLTVALTGTGTTVSAQLSLTPTSLAFGTVSLGSSSSLSLTLTNASTTTVNAIALTATSGFTVSGGCGANLGPGSSCPIVVTFTPTFTGVAAGTLTVSSSDAASPLVAALTGNVVATGGFVLTVDGSDASSATVQSGAPATYALKVTPSGGYTGTVDLTCSADTPVAYTACSLVPPSVTLSGSAQSSTATINTVSAVALGSAMGTPLRHTALWCLSPALLALLLRRRRPAALLILFFAALLSGEGCGSGGDPRIRYAVPGTYTFHVTATSTTSTPVSQSVTLTLVVKPKP